jgi:flagellar basal-body rod protein FlgC
VTDHKPGQPVYDPKHPDADAKGYVLMPNVNVMEEMVNMISASRAYEANVQAIGATRAMWNHALEIGRS